MTTLAEFKRATTSGDRFEVTRHDLQPELVGSTRTARTVTARSVFCLFNGREDENVVWRMPWPAARDVTTITDDEITYRLMDPETPRHGIYYMSLRRVPRGDQR